MREFLNPFDTRLNLYSREVAIGELSSDAIKSVINDMLAIASGERDEAHPNRPTLVGLSAPQLGEMLRILLLDTSADPVAANFEPNLKVFVNPRITNASPEQALGREGCYSTGRICGAVLRASQVTVAALNEMGEEFEYTSANTFQSAILQHEIDHFNGIRFPSRITDPKHLHYVDAEDFQDYRENWRTWTKLCPMEDWLKMFGGKNG